MQAQGRLVSGRLASRVVVLVIAGAVVVTLAAGCGHSGPPKSSVVTCGTAKTAANVPVSIKVMKGHVACSDAMTVERNYAKAIMEGKEPGNGGGGPVVVSGWRCQGFDTPKVLKTGWASECTRSSDEILAVLAQG
jgi:hypothetical protein